MPLFKDSVSGSDKKHTLWQHYINGDFFVDDTDEIKVQSNPSLVLPTEEGGKRITRATLEQWLMRLMPNLKPEEQIALRVIFIIKKGFHTQNRLYSPSGQLPFGKVRNEINTLILEEIRDRQSSIQAHLRKASTFISKSITDDDETHSPLQKKCSDLATSKARMENLLKSALNENVNALTSSKETATMIFACLTGFASGAVPGISLGALGYTLAFSVGFALGATPVGWLIGGALIFGAIGAIAIYTFNHLSRKHDDKSHEGIYNKSDIADQIKQANINIEKLLILSEMQSNQISRLNKMIQNNNSTQDNPRGSLRRNSATNSGSLSQAQFAQTFQPSNENNGMSDSSMERSLRRNIIAGHK